MDRQKLEEAKLLIKEIDELKNLKIKYNGTENKVQDK